MNLSSGGRASTWEFTDPSTCMQPIDVECGSESSNRLKVLNAGASSSTWVGVVLGRWIKKFVGGIAWLKRRCFVSTDGRCDRTRVACLSIDVLFDSRLLGSKLLFEFDAAQVSSAPTACR